MDGRSSGERKPNLYCVDCLLVVSCICATGESRRSGLCESRRSGLSVFPVATYTSGGSGDVGEAHFIGVRVSDHRLNRKIDYWAERHAQKGNETFGEVRC